MTVFPSWSGNSSALTSGFSSSGSFSGSSELSALGGVTLPLQIGNWFKPSLWISCTPSAFMAMAKSWYPSLWELKLATKASSWIVPKNMLPDSPSIFPLIEKPPPWFSITWVTRIEKRFRGLLNSRTPFPLSLISSSTAQSMSMGWLSNDIWGNSLPGITLRRSTLKPLLKSFWPMAFDLTWATSSWLNSLLLTESKTPTNKITQRA